MPNEIAIMSGCLAKNYKNLVGGLEHSNGQIFSGFVRKMVDERHQAKMNK